MKRFLLKSLVSLALISVMISAAYAQTPTVVWTDALNVGDMAVSKDGNYVIVAGSTFSPERYHVRFYRSTSGTPLWTATSDTERFYSVAISADGDCVAVGSWTGWSGGFVYFVKNARSLSGAVTQAAVTWSSVDLGGGIYRRCLDMSDDGNYVVACGTGRWVFYWANAKGLSGSGKPTTWKSPQFPNVACVDLSSDGNYVAAGIEDAGNDWSVAYWKNTKTLTGNDRTPDWKSAEPDSGVIGVAVSDDGDYVAASSSYDTVYYWANAKSLSGNPSTKWWSGLGVSFASIKMSSDGSSVIAGAEGPNRGVYFWAGAKGLTGKPQNPSWIYTTTGDVHDVAISSAGDYMAAVNDVVQPHLVYFLDNSGKLKWSYTLDNPGFVLSMSTDASTLAVGTTQAYTAYMIRTGYSTPQSRPVGGVVTPVNKLAILTPYLALAGLVIAVSAVIMVKKRSKD